MLSEHAEIVLVEAGLAALQWVEVSSVTPEVAQRTQPAVVDPVNACLVEVREKAVLAPEPEPAAAQLALAQCIAESIRR